MKSQQISLNSIRIDCGTQMRIDQNSQVVDEYAERLADGVEFPPIVVFTDGTEFWLADGFHRYFAHRKAGHDTIACEVRQGTLNDALEFACRANQAHGLRRTNADKRRAVEEYFKIPGHETLNNSEVARRLGVSVPFVKEVREKHGIKASPSAHVGIGSSEGFKRLNKSTISEPSTFNVELPDNNEHEFAIALLRYFKPEYLKSCAKYLCDCF